MQEAPPPSDDEPGLALVSSEVAGSGSAGSGSDLPSPTLLRGRLSVVQKASKWFLCEVWTGDRVELPATGCAGHGGWELGFRHFDDAAWVAPLEGSSDSIWCQDLLQHQVFRHRWGIRSDILMRYFLSPFPGSLSTDQKLKL
eukprot:14180751-Alexandrium_andersonii.AAC.2